MQNNYGQPDEILYNYHGKVVLLIFTTDSQCQGVTVLKNQKKKKMHSWVRIEINGLTHTVDFTSHVLGAVTGNLWMVWAIGCNEKFPATPTINIPRANAWAFRVKLNQQIINLT